MKKYEYDLFQKGVNFIIKSFSGSLNLVAAKNTKITIIVSSSNATNTMSKYKYKMEIFHFVASLVSSKQKLLD